MTGTAWLVCGQPTLMFDHLARHGRICPRRQRLFAAACCRRKWEYLTEPASRAAIEVAERYARGMAVLGELAVARRAARSVANANRSPRHRRIDRACLPLLDAAHLTAAVIVNAREVAVRTARVPDSSGPARFAEAKQQCDLLRDIFPRPDILPSCSPAWRTDNVLALARTAWADHDPALFPILADALEDAGAIGDLLTHPRGPGPHVRGCWALDLVLAKG